MAQVVTRVLTVVLSIATARALEPTEVGLLGLAVIVISLISMIGYYPETAAVVSRGSESHETHAVASAAIRALLSMFLLGCLLLSVSFLGGYLTGTKAGSESLRELIGVLVYVPFLEFIGAYPRVLLQRKLDLNSVSFAALLQPVIFVGIAIFLLSKGYGYVGVAWANVIGIAVGALFLWLCIWFRGWLRWGGWPSRNTWREIGVGAARVFVGGFGGFLGERLDNLLVSSALGPTAMSYYSMAWSGARTPANVFGGTIGFVLVPTLSRIQTEPSRVRRAVLESLKHSYLLLAPISAMLFVSAPMLVIYVLGPKWLPLVPCLRIMCVTVMAVPMLHACNALLVGAGRAHLTGIATSVHLLMLAVTIPLFAHYWHLIGAAVGDLVSIAALSVTLLVTTHLATRRIDSGIISTFAMPIVAACLAGAVAWKMGQLLESSLLRLASEISLVATVYVLSIFLLGGRNRLYDLLGVLRAASRKTVAA